MSSPGYIWDDIENEIQVRSAALTPDRQHIFINCVYTPQRWAKTTRKSMKGPCSSCGDQPSGMYRFQDIHCRLPEPLLLCDLHYHEWKTDPRTTARRKEEEAKRQEKKNQNLSHGRPRDPSGWYLDLQDVITEINTLTGKTWPVPRIDQLSEPKSLRALNKANAIKNNLILSLNELKAFTEEESYQ